MEDNPPLGSPLPLKQQGEPRAVFISHAGTDTWIAKQLAKYVEEMGGKAFLDEVHIAVGEDFEDRILVELDEADELLVLLTPWSLSRPYVWAEIGAAWGRRKPVIGILYGLTPEELHTKAGVPVLLKRRDIIELNQVDTYFNQLSGRIHQKAL